MNRILISNIVSHDAFSFLFLNEYIYNRLRSCTLDHTCGWPCSLGLRSRGEVFRFRSETFNLKSNQTTPKTRTHALLVSAAPAAAATEAQPLQTRYVTILLFISDCVC